MTLDLRDTELLTQEAYIGGRWQGAQSGETLIVRNPATGTLIGTVPRMGASETRQAISSAKLAQPGWQALTAKDRSRRLRKWHDLMIDHEEDLAAILTAEQGKPLSEALGEIRYAASYVEWFSEEAKRTYGEVIPSHKSGANIIVTQEPVGVVAALTPWNFPSAMITRKVAPALAAGCTIIVKPASATPLSALALCKLAERAGIPAGVFSVITGQASAIAGEMTENPDIRKISFTGSTEIGKRLMAESAGTLKRLSLELGGNAPFIVFEDADIDRAVEGAMASKFRNSGQTCVCTNRFLVHDNIYDRFSKKLNAAISRLTVGPGSTAGVTQGPLIDEQAVRKVEQHIADALGKGAILLRGGQRHRLGGTFFEPTLLGNVPLTAELARDETFGPVAPLFRFRTEEQAVLMANDTDFGLAAYVFTKDLGRAFRMSAALQYGMVGINDGLISTEVAPFGGIKASGFGREGSRHGISEYLQLKYTLMGGCAA